MAGNLTNYLENKLLDHFLGTTAYTMPSPVYVALFTVAPGDAGGGTEVTEVAMLVKQLHSLLPLVVQLQIQPILILQECQLLRQ